MSPAGGAVFADLVRTLEPYLGEVVFIGGWVQALYVLEADGDGARVVRTADIDVTLADTLHSRDRPPLLGLLKKGGFHVTPFPDDRGFEISKDSVDVDLLTEGPGDGDPVDIEGQPGLRAFGYPNQALLRTNTREIIVGAEVHESLSPPQKILVPTLPAYVLVKLLSSSRRAALSKRAKDLVYVYELMARAPLAAAIIDGMPALTGGYSAEARSAKEWLVTALEDPSVISEGARQIVEGSGFAIEDETPVQAQLRARLRLLLAKGLGAGGGGTVTVTSAP